MSKPACKTCGRRFAWEPGPAGGRPPLHCPKCRKPTGDKTKAKGKRRRKPDPSIDPMLFRAASLALAMSVLESPAEAAKLAGLDVEPDELAALTQAARASFAELIDGSPEGGGQIIDYAILRITLEAVAQCRELNPRDMAIAANRLGGLRSLFLQPRTNGGFSALNINFPVVAPSGGGASK